MYNTFPYNANVYNDLHVFGVEADQDDIVFNGYSLQDNYVSRITQELLHDSPAQRDFMTAAVPAGDGEIVNSDYWRRKTILLKGIVKKATSALLEAELTAMKKALAVREGFLDIKIDGAIRRYIATTVNTQGMFQGRKGYHINFVPFDIQFLCLTPYGKDVNYTSAQYVDQTLLVLNDEVNNLGNAKAQPVVILNFSVATGVTAIKFENVTTGESITLTVAIIAGDYVRFDSENKEVKLNGALQDYTGSFPQLESGLNSVRITITGTAATYTPTIKFKNSYY